MEGVVSAMKDAETGQRGYLITGEDRYLEPYDSALSAIKDQVQRLKQLIEDDPRQQARIVPLEEQISAKLKELGRTVALRKKDPEAARQIVLTDEGKSIMDAIRGQVREMEQEEGAALVLREQQSRRSYVVSVLTMLFALILSLGMVGVLFHLLRRHLWERQKAEEERARSAAEILRKRNCWP